MADGDAEMVDTTRYSRDRGAIVLLYALGITFLVWSIFTLAYQYIAAIGSLSEVVSAWKETRILSALWLSILSSLATVVIAVVLGVPLAYFFALGKFRGKTFFETLAVDVPQTFPPIAEGMIYYFMLGPHSPFHINLAFTFSALIIAKVYVSAPFVISAVTTQFRQTQMTGMGMTARSLGASPFQVFTMILLPLARNNIIAGAALCWARAMGELGGSLIFAGVLAYQTEIIPTFIAVEAHTNHTAALAASIAVTAASTIAIFSFKRLTRR